MKAHPNQKGSLWTRRQFTSAMGLAAGAVSTAGWSRAFGAAAGASAAAGPRKKVALIITEAQKYAHAQHFLDRLLEGYGWGGEWHYPPLELAGLYADQFPEGELARERARRHNVTIYPSIPEALTLGGSKLAVEGVIIIGEHGVYPKNKKGQTLYPRYKWFKEVVKVFESGGRAVPVFNDKHLSTSWTEAAEMVADSRRLGFAFLAGSSLPVTWRLPELELPLNAPLVESVSVCYGGVDSYDFHGLETAQCMSERRAGGETGVRSVHALRGERVWEALRGRAATGRLLLAALSRSETLSAPPGYTLARPALEMLRRASPDTVAYFIEHLDGFQTTMFMLNGSTKAVAGADQQTRNTLFEGRAVRDFTYAGRLKSGEIVSCKMHLPMPPWYATLADFFNPLMHHVETMILQGRAPQPIERALLTTGLTAFAMESLDRGELVETPELKVSYQAVEQPQFWRA